MFCITRKNRSQKAPLSSNNGFYTCIVTKGRRSGSLQELIFSKRRARGSNLEASVMALKTATYARSRLRARGSIYALASVRGAQLNYLLWSARGSTLEPSPVAAKAYVQFFLTRKRT